MGTGANALVMKQINVQLVRRALKQMGEGTKLQLAEATGLSTVTVGTVLQRLVEEGSALDVGLVASMGGRPAQLFRYNAEFAHALVLFTHAQDGEDLLRVRVVNLQGAAVYAADAPLAEVELASFEAHIEAALRAYPTIRAIGFGLPGVEWGGKLLAADYPALAGTAFRAHYHERFGLPVVVHNDVNAACVGYCRRHAVGDEAAAVYLYFPQKYPPGGGIYLEGKLYRGAGSYAGEVAGMPLGIDWRDATLYESPARICAAIATLIAAVSFLLNPERVILSGPFLGEEALRTIKHLCAAGQPAGSMPQLALAADFALDYFTGLAAEALALLEPPAPISL